MKALKPSTNCSLGLGGQRPRTASVFCSAPTAEVYIGIGKPAEATACTQEAANLFPMSHNVLYMRGQVAELRGNFDEARRWYEEALSISPTHVKSMQRLVSLRPRPGPPFLEHSSPWKQQVAYDPPIHSFPRPSTVSLLKHKAQSQRAVPVIP